MCRSTTPGVIAYNRDNAILHGGTLARLRACNSNLVGFKDGIRNIALMTRIPAKLTDLAASEMEMLKALIARRPKLTRRTAA